MSIANTRDDLCLTIDTAITDASVRVRDTPYRPGSFERSKALVTIGFMYPSGDELDRVECELEIQVDLGKGIDQAFTVMDTVLTDVDAAIPVNWEAASWSMEVDQDDQPVLRAMTLLAGHLITGSGTTWSESGIEWSQSGVTWTGGLP